MLFFYFLLSGYLQPICLSSSYDSDHHGRRLSFSRCLISCKSGEQNRADETRIFHDICNSFAIGITIFLHFGRKSCGLLLPTYLLYERKERKGKEIRKKMWRTKDGGMEELDLLVHVVVMRCEFCLGG